MKRRALRVCLVVCLTGSALFLTLALVGDRTHAQEESTLYVAPGADCGGEQPCYAHPQDAVDEASEGDTIKVAAGTYTGVSARSAPPDYPDPTANGLVTQTVYISKTLTLRGGYTTTNWADASPVANPTTLNAQGGGRVLLIAGAISPTIEGLYITGGAADGLGGRSGGSSGYAAGGGMYIIAATVIISNNQMLNSSAEYGGGLYLDHGSAILTSNAISHNFPGGTHETGHGGGLYLDHSSATLTSNTITRNYAGGYVAGWGGGVYLDNSTVTLISNTISHNGAGGLHGDGGGLCMRTSSATLISNTISHNSAGGSYSGGAGGGVYVIDGDAVFVGNTISYNESWAKFNGRGGGVCLYGANATLIGNIILGNSTGGLFGGEGGGVCLGYCDGVTLTNNVVAGNQAGVGSELYIQDSSARLLHTTVVGNGGSDSGAYVGWATTVALTNTILVSQTVGITVTTGSTASLTATLWGTDTWGNASDWGGDGTIITGTINIWDDPGFVDPVAGDYHIDPASASIDRGVDAVVTTDIDGEPRPDGCFADIGADEYQGRVCYRDYLPVTFRSQSPWATPKIDYPRALRGRPWWRWRRI